ncbi:MAG: PspC domain-containing protein [Coriobacteriales bacterium]|jgi:phage shock protein PspC (stress-responsive transcriptional regulator)|nr:PspC domain-containing protein [Coriobacteriales bacterium]
MKNSGFNKNNLFLLVGVLLVLFGLWQLAERVLGVWFEEIAVIVSFIMNIVWPLAIISGGILLMLAARKGSLNLPQGKKLFRSSKSRKLAGVCGGIAEYLGVDAAMVRIATIILAILCWYVIIPLYILFWIVIPYDTKNYSTWV